MKAFTLLSDLKLLNFTAGILRRSSSWSRTRLNYLYNQPAVEELARKEEEKISPFTLLCIGDSPHYSNTLLSAQYLHKELPVRFAHSISYFRMLPFLIGCNPTIYSVHDLYIQSFHQLRSFRKIVEQADADAYLQLLYEVQHKHRDVIMNLAEGLKDAKRHIEAPGVIHKFLNDVLTSRLGTKLLIEHHIGLVENRKNYVGAICTNFSPKHLIEGIADSCRSQCLHRYGMAPIVRLNGHLNARLPCIVSPLEYAVGELLKNAFRATCEVHSSGSDVSFVKVTISHNSKDLIIRVSDRGGGVPHDVLPRIFDYHVTTSSKQSSTAEGAAGALFGEIMSPAHSGPSAGPMHGSFITHVLGLFDLMLS